MISGISYRAVAIGALLTALPFSARAATPLSPQDTMFAMKAAQAGMTEVKLAAVALQKSKNPHVLAFAREMNADHTKANKQLTAVVGAKGLRAPSSVGPANQTAMAKLQSQSGPAFDSMYLSSQLPAHQKVLALFKAEVSSGSDTDLVAFAKKTIPVIESHIAMDKSDISKLGAAAMAMPASK